MCHIPPVPEISLDSLINAVLSALPTSIQVSDETPNWKCLPQDTSTKPDTGDLKSLERIIMATIDFQSNGFSPDVTFQIARKSVLLAPSHDPFHPDEFFYLRRCRQASSEVNWEDIIIPIECDSLDDECNEVNVNARMIYSMHHVMYNDPRRQFVLGLTCENTKARLWYHSRCRIVCSEEFDIKEDQSQLVRIILSVVLSSPDRLGIDPDMELVPSTHPDTKPSYNITIRNSDTGEATRYRTLDMISGVGTESMLGSGTRLWIVQKLVTNKPSGPQHMLKDTWLHGDYTPEHVILKEIREAQPSYSQHLPTPLDHRFGTFGAAPHSATPGMELIGTSKVLVIDCYGASIRSKKGPNTSSDCAVHPGLPRSHPKGHSDFSGPSEYPCKQYRIVFKETGTPVHDLHDFYDIFTAVDGGLKGARAMHLCKYVHRDISSRNILLVCSGPFGRRGVLADLEYAKKIDDPNPPHDVKTGTAACMATEVGYMSHFRLGEFRRPQVGSLDPAQVKSRAYNQPKPLPPFRYNPLHDLESIWWTCVWAILYLAPVGQDSSAQLETFHRVFFDTSSKHEFLCNPAVFQDSTTHLKGTRPFVGLMGRWAALLNGYYEVAYKQQDASEANLERIRVGDDIVEMAYDGAQEILESLKQTSKSLSTRCASLEERSYDETSTTTTEPRKGGFSTLTTKRRIDRPATKTTQHRKKGPTGKTSKGLKREAPVESSKKQKGDLSVKAASREPDFWIELPPVRRKARTKHNDKLC